jgi:crossover junction endodeoxyribonuclease RuvC
MRGLFNDIHPEVVVVERVFFQTNVRTAMSVAQASGIAIAEAALREIPVVQMTANEVKLALTGYGAATKEQVQAMVARQLGLTQQLKPADVADALALAIAHLSSQSVAAAIAKAAGQ